MPALLFGLIELGNGLVSGRVFNHPNVEEGSSVSFSKRDIVWDNEQGEADDPYITLKGVRVYLLS